MGRVFFSGRNRSICSRSTIKRTILIFCNIYFRDSHTFHNIHPLSITYSFLCRITAFPASAYPSHLCSRGRGTPWTGPESNIMHFAHITKVEIEEGIRPGQTCLQSGPIPNVGGWLSGRMLSHEPEGWRFKP